MFARFLVERVGADDGVPAGRSRRRPIDRLVGLAAVVESASIGRRSTSWIEATPSGWWYSAPGIDGRWSAVFFTDADLAVGSCRRTLAARWSQAVAEASPHGGAAQGDRISLAGLDRPARARRRTATPRASARAADGSRPATRRRLSIRSLVRASSARFGPASAPPARSMPSSLPRRAPTRRARRRRSTSIREISAHSIASTCGSGRSAMRGSVAGRIARSGSAGHHGSGPLGWRPIPTSPTIP